MPHSYDSDAHPRVREFYSSVAKATDGLTKDPSGRDAPFPALRDLLDDYELSVWIQFNYDSYRPSQLGHYPPVVSGDYVLACGREKGLWRLRTCPVVGEDCDGEVLGAPIVDVCNQVDGLQPLTLLRALLAGRLA